MNEAAQNKNEKILLTGVDTYLGSKLAEELLNSNLNVYAIGSKHPPSNLFESQNFTYLKLDLKQPLPSHLPNFSKVIHLAEKTSQSDVVNLKSLEAEKLFIATPLDHLEKLTDIMEKSNLVATILAVGHIYGPDMHLVTKRDESEYFTSNLLVNLISQSILTDKIILEKEGTETIYPTYIDDAIGEILRELNSDSKQQTRFIISNPPQSSLSLSYEIQNKARSILDKDLNIYFSGPQIEISSKDKLQLKINISQSTQSFNKGLEETLLSLKGETVHKIQPDYKEEKPIINIPKTMDQNQPKPEKVKKTRKISLLSLIKKPKGGKIQKVLLFLLIVALLFTFRFVQNLYSGASDMKTAQSALYRSDFELARQKSQNAQKHFSSAHKSIGTLASPFSRYNPIKNYANVIESLKITASSLTNFTEASNSLSKHLKYITDENEKTNADLTSPGAQFLKSYFDMEHAIVLVESASNSWPIQNKVATLQDSYKQLSSLSQIGHELAILSPQITGDGTPKVYLVLLMNNAELRPGGGFIGTFAEISFGEGKLQSIDVGDIYEIDGQLKEIITPPPQLTQKLGVEQLYLRDSNWSADFRTNAQTARDFYKKETGKSVDGVIALDLTLVENLLAKIGPVKLEDYEDEITSTNLLEKGQYYSEVGFFPGSTQKKDFFSSLTSTLFIKMFERLSTPSSQPGDSPTVALFETIAQGLAQKHLMLSMDNANLNSIITSKGWDNAFPPLAYNPKDDTNSTRDFLMLSEANIGANKVNRFLKREVNYEMTIGRDADLTGTLTVTYKNESPADTWPAGTYVNFLRIYAPANSTLTSYLEDGREVDLEQTIRGVTTSTVETEQVGELTQFAKLIEIPVKQTKTYSFKYRIPKNIKLETAPNYELYVSKQPGTLSDPFKFKFNLPGYLVTESVNEKEEKGKQNIEINSDLTTDLQFNVEVKRK